MEKVHEIKEESKLEDMDQLMQLPPTQLEKPRVVAEYAEFQLGVNRKRDLTNKQYASAVPQPIAHHFLIAFAFPSSPC